MKKCSCILEEEYLLQVSFFCFDIRESILLGLISLFIHTEGVLFQEYRFIFV